MENIDFDKNVKFLIVDDDNDVREFLERFLKQKGYQQIQKVDSGEEAIKVCEKEDINLVLLDIKLPDRDGISVLKEIKKMKKNIGVIMITGFPEEESAKEAMKLGAYDYIMKPFDLAYLELCVFTKIFQPLIIKSRSHFLNKEILCAPGSKKYSRKGFRHWRLFSTATRWPRCSCRTIS